ncbi:MAG: NAD(+)/NADH kinase [Atopobiaceae bacterium]|nr:NAD(+)/NADH kinase [Atopobiaceae bacterium]
MEVLIVPNYSKPDAVEAAHTITDWLEGEGVDVRWAHDKKLEPMMITTAAGSDLVVSLGGDGTLLRAAKIIGYDEVPLLGLSFGHLGFLTGADNSNVVGSVAAALAGGLHMTRRATLDVECHLVYPDGTRAVEHHFALNDVALNRGVEGDMIEFDISASGNHIDRLRGDGFVIATATGSTGYALAAGGPVVTPDFNGMVCVPIAPHTILARAFLAGSSDVVELDMRSVDRPAARTVFVDGQLVGRDAEVELVVARRGPGDILLLSGENQTFYKVVSRVFWGRDAR